MTPPRVFLLFTCIVVGLLGCFTIVEGGSVQATFSELDFSVRENVGELPVTIFVTGNQQNGDIVFHLEAITSQEYMRRSAINNNTCGDTFSLQSATEDTGELNDFNETEINCTSEHTGENSKDVICSFQISNDAVFEGDEYLVIVMTVLDTAGNDITFGRRCTIGRILTNSITDERFFLELEIDKPRPVNVTEGEAPFFLRAVKKFESELAIEVSYSITSDLLGTPYNSPSIRHGVDYTFNRNKNSIVIHPNETQGSFELAITDDQIPEKSELFTILFQAYILDGSSRVRQIEISPDNENILILDNDAVTVGFETTDETRTLLEGDQINLCAVVLSHDAFTLQKDVIVQPTVTEGTAKAFQHYRVINGLSRDDMTLGLYDRVCIDIEAVDDDIVERSRSFEVRLEDVLLSEISDPDEREKHQRYNIISPCCVTVTIEDNDGLPLQPIITKLTTGQTKDQLFFEWTVDEEDGLRPIDCYYGNITEASRPEDPDKKDSDKESGGESDKESGGESDNDETPTDQTTRQAVYPFNFCGSPNSRNTQFTLPDIQTTKQYTIVVCARNRFGDNCTAEVIFVQPTSAPVTVAPGLIAGVVVAVVLVVCCCLILILLLCLFFLCGWERERRYFPQRREKKLAKEYHRHYPHNSVSSVSDDDFEEVKVPL